MGDEEKTRTWKLGPLEVTVESTPIPDASTSTSNADGYPMGLRRTWLFLPLFAVLTIRLAGLVFYDWSMISDGWPRWFTALFVVALGCAGLGAYLERRDRREAGFGGR